MLCTASVLSVNANPVNATAKLPAIDQTITFSPISAKTYTDFDFSPGATASSGLTVTYISSDATVARVINGGTTIRIVGAGIAVITAEQPGNAEYNRATRVSQTLTVNKADLTITAVSQARTYGSNNATLGLAYTGLRNGETGLTPAPRATTSANAASGVGSYPIILNGGTSNNYNIIRVNGTLTITPANLTIRADNKTKAYGAANPTLTVTYTGFRNNDTFTKLTTRPVITTTAVRNSNPGVYPITASGASSNNYNINYIDGGLTISRSTLTIMVAAKTKVYGGAVPALTYTITGFAPGQTEASLTSPVVISTAVTRNSPVGSYPITASGATSDNYDIRYVQSTLRVTKAALTITANNATRIYGSDNPEFDITYRGFVLGETAEDLTTQPIATTAATASSRANTYSIRASGATSDNYSFTYVAGILTVTKAPLRIAAQGKTRAYGEDNPELTLTYTGFVNGEDEDILTTKPTVSTTANVRSAVGRYPITPRGATATNYTITYGNGTLVIGKADLTITANNITRLYGATSPALTVSYDGFANGETVTVLTRRPTLTSPGTSTSPAGTYAITPSGATAVNYNLIYQDGTLTIAKRKLTITAADKSRSYGQANPALTATYTGLVNNDRATVILNGERPELSTDATPASAPGTYPIEINGGLTADNYEVVLVNGTLTVGNATLTITANSISKTYGQANPRLSYTITGYVNGDDRSVFTDLPTTPVTSATAESPVGTYNITTGGAAVSNPYYDLKYVTGKLTIGKALLSVRAANKSRVYGQPNPEFTYTINGFVNNDTREDAITKEPTVSTTATEASPVGSNYNIQGRGATADNYSFSYITGKLTITPAALVIKANDTTRRYGEPNPEFTATYTGLASFDTPASLNTPPTFATTAVAGSIPGQYPITVSGASSPNYTITYADGMLTIGRPLLTVKANNQARNYGVNNPELTLTYSGFLNGDNESIFTTLPTAATTAMAASNAGTYEYYTHGWH
ncbi:MBG domain-containing protein [Mucilaginibacter terrae]|uniref:MBG domain-containing protein n=1 Tax=Mucilaginibacter terrae TaxID=1955052 RepID=A0ABU3GV96_9SPHI|nr:MBG domain-containing protein [Mucilaginibacter terrae]MDT3403698.1 hypothetical protein [Mucilaginibacter terrae]